MSKLETGVSPQGLILLGKVLRPHGLEGGVRIWSHAESENSFLVAGTVFLKTVSGDIRQYRVISVRPHMGKNIFLMKLEGVTSRDAAEQYRGSEILCDREVFQRGEDEYFWHELLGLEVYLATGEHIGSVSEIIPSGQYDIYVVTGGGKEVCLPATYETIQDIDLKNGKMIVTPAEGLLELNEV